MNVNTKTMVSISEANQNFSKVARLVDQYGSAVILKENHRVYQVNLRILSQAVNVIIKFVL